MSNQKVKQFSGEYLYKLEGLEFYPWGFNCSMVGTCEPLFDCCDSNYEVEDILRENKVIGKQDQTDSESCCMYVYFKNKQQGQRFINRLNKYLVKRYNALRELRAIP